MTTCRPTLLLACALTLPLGTACGDTTDAAGSDETIDVLHARARPTAPENSVSLESISASGAGCPAGSFDAVLSEDGSGLEWRFEKFAVSVASPQTPVIKRAACNLSFRLRGRPGTTYALESVTFAGEAKLTPGLKASAIANLALTGFGVADVQPASRVDIAASGPFELTVKPEALQWAPCEGLTSNLQLRTSLVLEGTGTGEARLSSFEGLRLVTRSCSDEPSDADGGVDAATADSGAPLPTIDAGAPLPTVDAGTPSVDGGA